MHLRLLKLLTLCFVLTACVMGTSQNAKFYTITSQPTDSISASYKSFVGVTRIQAPKYMDRPQIVTQNQNSPEMVVSEYNRWVENPSVLATRALVENLSALLPSAQIKMDSFGLEKFDKVVSVEIVKMNAIFGEKATLEVWYTIKNKNGKLLTHQKFIDSVKIGNNYDDLAVGYSHLLGGLSQDIARNLIEK